MLYTCNHIKNSSYNILSLYYKIFILKSKLRLYVSEKVSD